MVLLLSDFSTQYDLFLSFLSFKISFLKIFMINEVAVTTVKKTTPIIIGDITVPRNIPNLNHSLLNGVKILEFKSPKIRKIIETIKDHILKFPPSINGYVEIIKKTIKKTIPKL